MISVMPSGASAIGASIVRNVRKIPLMFALSDAPPDRFFVLIRPVFLLCTLHQLALELTTWIRIFTNLAELHIDNPFQNIITKITSVITITSAQTEMDRT